MFLPFLDLVFWKPPAGFARLRARFRAFRRSTKDRRSLPWLASIFARRASSIWGARAPVMHSGPFTALDRPFAIACQAAPHHRDGRPLDRCVGDDRCSPVAKGAAFWGSDVHRGARVPVFCHGVYKSRTQGYLSATKRKLGSVTSAQSASRLPIEQRSIS